MVGTEHEQVVATQAPTQAPQTHVERFQCTGITEDITPMPVDTVEIDEIGRDQAAIADLVHGQQGGIEQGIVSAGVHAPADAARGENIRDLADRDHLVAMFDDGIEQGRCRWRQRIVAAIAGAHEIIRRTPDKRPRDDASDIERVKQATGDLARRVKAFKAEAVFVGGNLEYRVGRGVDDRTTAVEMLLAKTLEDFDSRGMAVAEHARQAGFLDQGLQQLRWKTVFGVCKMSKGLADDDPGRFPVTGRGVLAGGTLAGIAPQAFRLRQIGKACSHPALRGGMRMRQAETTQVRQAQRSARSGGAGGGNMAEGIRALVAPMRRVRGRTDAQGVKHEPDDPAHARTPGRCQRSSRGSAGASSSMRNAPSTRSATESAIAGVRAWTIANG